MEIFKKFIGKGLLGHPVDLNLLRILALIFFGRILIENVFDVSIVNRRISTFSNFLKI